MLVRSKDPDALAQTAKGRNGPRVIKRVLRQMLCTVQIEKIRKRWVVKEQLPADHASRFKSQDPDALAQAARDRNGPKVIKVGRVLRQMPCTVQGGSARRQQGGQTAAGSNESLPG